MALFPVFERHLQPEIMDQPDLDSRQHEIALQALSRINFWSGSLRIVWKPIYRLARRLSKPYLSVLDIACGSGDNLRRLQKRAAGRGLKLQLFGCDISPVALDLAQQHSEATSSSLVTFFRCDVLNEPLPQEYDVVMCSLFLHHLDQSRAVKLLTAMREPARHLVLINDLERCRRGLWLAWLASRILTRSPVVHTDAVRSVQGAFTCEEAMALAQEAGLERATIRRKWPCRYLLEAQTGDP